MIIAAMIPDKAPAAFTLNPIQYGGGGGGGIMAPPTVFP